MMKHLIWGKDEAKSFLRRDWTGEISLKKLDKMTFTRTWFLLFESRILSNISDMSRRSARRSENSMAARGSGGLLLCLGLLLAMPARAATPADRDECVASADKLDVGGAACSRIIDDAGEQEA